VIVPVAEPVKLEWCRVGPDGKGYFWGSHGCQLGDHSATGDPHIHQCLWPEFDEVGNRIGTWDCYEIDDRTGRTRNEDGTWNGVKWEGWWQ
jgi:hypothetical protein